MAAERTSETKKKIISTAWKLFYQQGYENTTVEDIVAASGTSKGSFYHHFEGKDALLTTLSILFDEKYEELMQELDPAMHAVDKLLVLNRALFGMIENTVSVELLARLLSSQVITRGERHLLDRDRTYFRVLRQVVAQGQERGEIRADMTVGEIAKVYAMCERGLMYDWCLCEGSYSLRQYAGQVLPLFLKPYRAQ